jgi:abortive infection bacteriophage resistance protein
MKPLKPPITYNQQIEKLRSRGCVIDDVAFCTQVLTKINYYRLSAYFLPFRNKDGSYFPGTNFNDIYQIYEFDRYLRNLLFAAVEEIEIYLRAKFAYYHAHKYGEIGYLDAANYNSRHKHEKFKERINAEIKNNENVLFVKHHVNNYGGQFPIWVMTELFTFSMLSYFYSDLKTQDQKKLAKEMYNTVPKNIVCWLRCCTDLRNICAHYGRLYYRIFATGPAYISGLDPASMRRLFGTMLALKELYPDKNKWNVEIHSELKKLISSYSSVIKLNHIGFPPDWETRLMK